MRLPWRYAPQSVVLNLYILYAHCGAKGRLPEPFRGRSDAAALVRAQELLAGGDISLVEVHSADRHLFSVSASGLCDLLAHREAVSAKQSLKILIVENNELAEGLLARRLNMRNQPTITAASITEAISAFGNEAPDFMIVDVASSPSQCQSVVQGLKARWGEKTRAFVLTPGCDEPRCAGCDRLMIKPVAIDALMEAMRAES
jgi:CheY-like chemotaxis protein